MSMKHTDFSKLTNEELILYADKAFKEQEEKRNVMKLIDAEDFVTHKLVQSILNDAMSELPEPKVKALNPEAVKTVEFARKCVKLIQDEHTKVSEEITTHFGLHDFVITLETPYFCFGKSGDSVDKLITELMNKVDFVEIIQKQKGDNAWIAIEFGIKNIFKSYY